jgi:hypothetical protein
MSFQTGQGMSPWKLPTLCQNRLGYESQGTCYLYGHRARSTFSRESRMAKGSRPDGILKFVVECLASNDVAKLRASVLGAKNLNHLATSLVSSHIASGSRKDSRFRTRKARVRNATPSVARPDRDLRPGPDPAASNEFKRVESLASG